MRGGASGADPLGGPGSRAGQRGAEFAADADAWRAARIPARARGW